MKRVLLLWAGLIVPYCMVWALVTGQALLLNQTDHSGIKVVFVPQSTSAVLDSAYTMADGTYSLPISGGLYKVLFSKSGYQQMYYQNGTSLAIAATQSLTPVQLLPGSVQFVSGEVSGSWNSGNIYVVTGSLEVPVNKVLDIEQGVVVRFNPGLKLTVRGTLRVNGQNTNRVVFTSDIPTPSYGAWEGVIGLPGAVIDVKYCTMEYPHIGIYIQEGQLSVVRSEFRFFRGGGIYNLDGNPLIENCFFHSYQDKGEVWNWGVDVEGLQLNATVRCNRFENGRGYGVLINGDGIVENNIISGILNSDRGNGISVGNGSSALISNNHISNCVYGIRTGSSITLHPKATFANNTIVNCTSHGIWFDSQYAEGKVVNNVISNCPIGIAGNKSCSICYSHPNEISHNIFWSNGANFKIIDIPGIEQIVTTNSNGDATDSYFNIYSDPEFNDSSATVFLASSPCLAAGDTIFNSNLGFDLSFVCEDPLPSSAIRLNTFYMYPNPALEEVKVQSLEKAITQTLVLSNLTGNKLIQQSFTGSYDLSLKGVPPGVYLLSVTIDGKKSTQRLLVQQQ